MEQQRLEHEIDQLGKTIDSLYRKQAEARKGSNLQRFRVFQGIVDPRLLQASFHTPLSGLYNAAAVEVSVGGSKLFFEHKDKNFATKYLVDADEIYLWIERSYFIVAKKENYEQYTKKLLELNEIRSRIFRAERELADKTEKLEALKFWKQYDIPFDFTVDIKPVLSGLLEGSNGNGCKSNTKFHFILLEPVSVGKLSRNANEYLCSQSNGRHFFELIDHEVADGNKRQHTVTCKSCFKKMERWKIQPET